MSTTRTPRTPRPGLVHTDCQLEIHRLRRFVATLAERGEEMITEYNESADADAGDLLAELVDLANSMRQSAAVKR